MESIYIDTKTVMCIGERGAEHPRIFLNLEETAETICPYCSQHFIFKSS